HAIAIRRADITAARSQSEYAVFAQIIRDAAAHGAKLLPALNVSIAHHLHLDVDHGFALFINDAPGDHCVWGESEDNSLEALTGSERQCGPRPQGATRSILARDKAGPIHRKPVLAGIDVFHREGAAGISGRSVVGWNPAGTGRQVCPPEDDCSPFHRLTRG